MNTFALILIAILFVPFVIGLLVTLCFQRWGIHSLNTYTKEELNEQRKDSIRAKAANL